VDRKVLFGYDQRLSRDINGDDPGMREMFRQSDRNVATPRTNIQDSQRVENVAYMPPPGETQRVFDKVFRFGPRDQYGRTNAKRNGKELSGSGEVGNRHCVTAFLDQFSETAPRVGLHRFFVIQVEA
jgi:hypothetical protein